MHWKSAHLLLPRYIPPLDPPTGVQGRRPRHWRNDFHRMAGRTLPVLPRGGRSRRGCLESGKGAHALLNEDAKIRLNRIRKKAGKGQYAHEVFEGAAVLGFQGSI